MTQEQERAKGLPASCVDRMGKRGLALPAVAPESVLFFAVQIQKQCGCSVCFKKRKDFQRLLCLLQRKGGGCSPVRFTNYQEHFLQ